MQGRGCPKWEQCREKKTLRTRRGHRCGGTAEPAGPRRLGALEGAAATERVAAGGIMRRGRLLEVALAFTLLLASYTSHGADTNLEAGNPKETRANRAKRRGGGGHDALKG